MNKVSVDLDLNVTGYTQGLDKATQSTKVYETETKKITDAQVNLKKELVAARKLVQNLTAGYNALDAEAKKSSFGKEMKRQLEQAEVAAANYLDMQQDINTKLKNMSSDTHTLDMLSESFGVISSTASTAMGVIAQFTGNEEDARRAVVAFTTTESALTAVTKIHNALQMESNTMMAVSKIQTLAAAAAARVKTAAEGQGIVVTKAATVAQAAFNAVAEANPYVLLATAIVGVCVALGAYLIATQDAETETDKQNRKIAEARQQWNEYKVKVAEAAASQIADFISLQREWENLKTTEEKNQFLDENKNKFHAMGLEIDDVNELEKLFVKNSPLVIKALKARAEAEAWGEIYKQKLIKKLAADNGGGTVANGRFYYKAKAGDTITDEESRALGIANKTYKTITTSTGAYVSAIDRQITAEEAVRVNIYRNNKALKQREAEEQELTKIEEKRFEALSNETAAWAELGTEIRRTNKHSTGGGGTLTQDELTELEKLEKKVKDLEKERADIDIHAPNAQQLIQEINSNLKKAKEELNMYKITVGIEVEPSELDKMEAELKQKELSLRADIPQEQKDKIYQEILELREKIQQEKFKAHIEIDPSIAANKEIDKQINEILKSTTEVEKPKWDFSRIIEVKPEQEKMLNSLVNQYNRLYDAREKLVEMMNAEGASDDQIAKSQKALEQMEPLFAAILDKLNMFKDVNTEIETSNEKTKKLAETMTKIGEVTQSVGNAFAALGEVTNDVGVKIMGIVAQAIATVALSFAQALASTKTWVEWLAFGATGFATMLTMISQIKQATAGSYAHGGIVGGNSYSGDKLMAWVNSGEAILNKHQQKNLFDILDGKMTPYNNANIVEVTGVVHGTDLLLVQKNTSKVMKRAGNKIKII